MVLQYAQCKCSENDTANAKAIRKNEDKQVDCIVVFNASMTCFEEHAAGTAAPSCLNQK